MAKKLDKKPGSKKSRGKNSKSKDTKKYKQQTFKDLITPKQLKEIEEVHKTLANSSIKSDEVEMEMGSPDTFWSQFPELQDVYQWITNTSTQIPSQLRTIALREMSSWRALDPKTGKNAVYLIIDSSTNAMINQIRLNS